MITFRNHVQRQDLNYIRGDKRISDSSVFDGSIEKFIGLAQIPMGLAGPIKVNGQYASGEFSVPLATTEGTLVASYHRGAKIVNHCGGVDVICTRDHISRIPGFIFENLFQAQQFSFWCNSQNSKFTDIVSDVTRYGRLKNVEVTINGNYAFLHLTFSTGDAAGQNMVTIASDAICHFIFENAPVKPKHWFIESNLSSDKKPSHSSAVNGRGKLMTAEVTIPKKIIERFLRVRVETLYEYWQMSVIGSIQSGAIGAQGHYANGLAAIFAACGQDIACVAESSVGVTRTRLTSKKDLYVAVTLPSLIVGTVGGGTGLPTQKECLEIMDCYGEGRSKKFAEICTAIILAGEISIGGALAAGHFTQAHKLYGRK